MLKDYVIRALPKEVADKIAAGEVVERPLSVVKELTENAVDAGASSITVEIRKGGKEYIRVTDNGRGIAKDQVELAFRRYATSKIATADDLDAIETLGFRGEALASIAAVSRTEIVTKPAGAQIGTSAVYEGGELDAVTDAACEEGTTLIVRDLFYNLPARRKFLKPDSTESALIADYLSKMALAYPERRFRLISNGAILFSTTGKGGLYQAILTLYSPQTARTLLAVDAAEGRMALTGYVSSPDAARPNRRQQIFFVNGRWVRSKLLETALSAAFSDKLFEGRYPVAYLFLTVDPAEVDVNVHPSKTEVKFRDEGAVRDFVANGVRRALLVQKAAPDIAQLADKRSREVRESAIRSLEKEMEQAPSAQNRPFEPKNALPKAEAPAGAGAGTQEKSSNNINILQSTKQKEELFAELRRSEQLSMAQTVEEPQRAAYGEGKERSTEGRPAAPCFRFSSLRPIGQVFATYIIATDEECLYFIDQHAAHERVLYEQFLAAFNREETLSQPLLTPVVLSLTAAQKASEELWMPVLSALGFAAEEFGPSQVVLKEIPAVLELSEAEEFARSVIESEEARLKDFQTRRDAIIMASCKAAIKGGDRLHEMEALELFRRLDGCENPFSCPHGRPTFLRFSQGEIEHFFKRK